MTESEESPNVTDNGIDKGSIMNNLTGENENADVNLKKNASSPEVKFLPISNVLRIMKKALPIDAKISREANEAVQECASEFINFITGEASDKCQHDKRKTITGGDLLFSMEKLNFTPHATLLKVYLQKYRESEEEKSNGSSVQPTQNNLMHVDTNGASSSCTGLRMGNYSTEGNENGISICGFDQNIYHNNARSENGRGKRVLTILEGNSSPHQQPTQNKRSRLDSNVASSNGASLGMANYSNYGNENGVPIIRNYSAYGNSYNSMVVPTATRYTYPREGSNSTSNIANGIQYSMVESSCYNSLHQNIYNSNDGSQNGEE